MRLPSLLGATLTIAASCGPPQAARRSPDTLTAAREHDNVAQVSDSTAPAAPKTYTCGDTVLDDQPASGGERITTLVPCWDREEEAEHARHHQAAPAPELARARETHRGALAAASLIHCKGIPETELTHSPFAHEKSIAEVIPHRREGELAGVRIVFRDTPGLTADWMRQAIACHRARHEVLGRPASYLPEDPTLVEGAEVRVTQQGNNIQVFITTPTPGAGRIAYERASELVRPKAAIR